MSYWLPKFSYKVNYGSTSSCTGRLYTVTIRKDANIKSISFNGSASTTNISRSVRYGNTITIGATANDYYHFAKWSDGNTSRSRQIRVTGNLTLTASAGKNTVTVIYNANGGKLRCSGNTKSCQKTTNCHTKVDHHEVGCTGNLTGEVARYTYSFDNHEMNNYGLFDHKDPNTTLYMSRSGHTATYYWHVDSSGGKRIHEVNKKFNTIKEFAIYAGKESSIKTNANTNIYLFAGWN